MPPTGYNPGRAGLNVTIKLKSYEKQTDSGIAIPNDVGFKVNLPNRKSFSPDSAYLKGEKTGMKFLVGAPIFAVEVRSENDYGKSAEKAIKQQRHDYCAAGTGIVRDVDLLSDDVITSSNRETPDEPQIFRRGEIAEAEPASPKWKMAVDELFE